MADVENQPESSFPVKRKSDLCCQDEENVASKSQKLNSDCESKEVNSTTDENIETEPEKVACSEAEKEENVIAEDEEEDEDEEEEDYAIDRKGKGISREDKGKGKLIEVEESDDEDDSSDDDDDEEYGVDEGEESEFSDDPLAEVDLDNILPSRTRGRSFQPGVYISNDIGGNNEDDDSSDGSDA